ncbi:hypothetical protein DSO57_1015248 [Entomophthora muscae]|uniref:Uncharacterized protein n=1 Tax=Entomophthora muscae TaxID=34485 RepID=A0ACC2SI69_9FUNG|nr:hypothetical protein DSO57_1015248 [Entomophthora muscae]
MILPVLKFAVFSLTPFLLLLWSMLSDLWSKISSLLDLPSGLLFSGEAVVKSLTCDNLDLDGVDHALPAPVDVEGLMASLLSLEKDNLVSSGSLWRWLLLPPVHPGCSPVWCDGTEHLLPSAVPCVLSVVPPLGGRPSSPLGGILVLPSLTETVIKDKHLFKDMYGTLHRKMTDRTTIPYIPTHQQVDTILCCHRDLGHTKICNLYKFLKHKAWWLILYQDVQKVLEQCKVCGTFAKSKTPLKSVLPICMQMPFKVWAPCQESTTKRNTSPLLVTLPLADQWCCN